MAIVNCTSETFNDVRIECPLALFGRAARAEQNNTQQGKTDLTVSRAAFVEDQSPRLCFLRIPVWPMEWGESFLSNKWTNPGASRPTTVYYMVPVIPRDPRDKATLVSNLCEQKQVTQQRSWEPSARTR